MKLYELNHNYDWRIAFHLTSIDIKEHKFLLPGQEKTGMGKSDEIIISVLPEYGNSVFFSLGWPRASEWDETRNSKFTLQFSTEYLLDAFPCILLKNDHLQARSMHLEYFIDDPQEREEYLAFIQPLRSKNSMPTYADHPRLKKWTQEARNATPREYKTFVEEQLLIRGSSDIKKYFTTTQPYFEELLVQGKIPISEALSIATT